MDNHTNILLKLCRICTGRLQTVKEIRSKKNKIKAKDHMDSIFILYGIDISCDSTSIHPQFICTECYKRISNSRRTGTKGPNEHELNLDGVYGELKKWSEDRNIWCEHLDEHCKVCILYKEHSTPFSRDKAVLGRPKGRKEDLLFDIDSDNIFTQLFSPVCSAQCSSIEIVNGDDRDSFLCSVCRDIVQEHSVSTGCHHFCAGCLSSYFTKGKSNELPCPVCYKLCHVNDVHPISQQLLMILNKVCVKCVMCDAYGRLSAMRNHQCPSTPIKPGSTKQVSEQPVPGSATIAIQTTPKSCYKTPSSLKRSVTSPLDKTEEKVYTHLTRRKLQDDPEFLTCHTGGQRLHFAKIVKPRKSTIDSNSPLKQRRARHLAKVRSRIAGGASAHKQLSSELKLLSKTSRQQVCGDAGIKQSGKLSSQTLLAMKAALGLTTNQMRSHKRYLKSSGITYSSEKTEKVLTDDIFAGCYVQSKLIPLWHKEEKNPCSVKGMVRKSTPCIYVVDLQAFINHLLDAYQDAEKLIWENFPPDEVWVKIGGDHGGGSFKVSLQIANLKSPNSKENTIVFGVFEAKDYYTNLATITTLFTDGIKKLQNMTWNGRQVKVFIFGDYAFLCSLYGLSGPAGKFPCLWCTCSKEDMQTRRDLRTEMSARTLGTIKTQFRCFRARGSRKELAPEYQNAIHAPLWPVPVARVCPPYLHILLGVVKKHHELLEDECHEVDLMIAKEQAEVDVTEPVINATLFDDYVMKMRRVKKITDDNTKKKTEYRFEKKDRELEPKDKRALLQTLKEIIKRQEKMIDDILTDATLDKLAGPVTSNLDMILQEHNIKVQAFHSRSFTGNHCHKYLQEATIYGITSSIILKTKALTNSPEIIHRAEATAERFKQLNLKFGKIHASVSHGRVVKQNELNDVEANINNYLKEYRSQFPDKIFPKLHMLEDHVVQWMKKTGFGMGLMGEQGGESAHRVFNALKRTYGGMPDPLKRLNSIMKNHILSTHPRVTHHVINPKRRKLSRKEKPQ